MNQALLFQLSIVGLLSLSFFDRMKDYSNGFNEDAVQITLDTLFDDAGIPDGFQAQVYTPVCEADKCYAIEIIFRWDLIGRFIDYDTIQGSGLTKLDHIPFTYADYQRLHDILKNENSPLASYEKDQLVKDTRTSEIDGFTGATIAEIKENVIEGAVYSCYTLWHIAYGVVVNDLQQITYSHLNEELVQKMVEMKDQRINYYLIDVLTEDEFSTYNLQILQTIAEGKGYYPKNAIEKMPIELFAVEETQSFFAKEFENLNYFAQVAVLKKLAHKNLHPALSVCLENQLEERNSYRNDLIKEILQQHK